MTASLALFKFVAKAALNYIGFGVGGEFAVEVLPEVAKDVWQWWGKGRSQEQLRQELQEVAQLPPAEAIGQARQAVAEEAKDKPETEQAALTAYLSLIPAAIRQSQRRLNDPTGRTMSLGLSLVRSDDVLPLLPARLPRFKPGDRPPGIGDLELVELLGSGGFGEVWKARNPYFDGVPPVARPCNATARFPRVLLQDRLIHCISGRFIANKIDRLGLQSAVSVCYYASAVRLLPAIGAKHQWRVFYFFLATDLVSESELALA